MMQKQIFFGFLLVTALMIFGCDNQSEKAAEYNNRLIEIVDSAINELNNLETKLGESTAKQEIDKALLSYRDQVKKAGEKLENINDFKGDESLKKGAIDFVNHLEKSVASYQKAIDYFSLPDSLYGEREEQELTTLYGNIDSNYANNLVAFQEIQVKFADKFNFSLTDDNAED